MPVEVWPLVVEKIAKESKENYSKILGFFSKKKPKIFKKNKKVIDFDLFCGHDRDLTPSLVPLWVGSWDSLRA